MYNGNYITTYRFVSDDIPGLDFKFKINFQIDTPYSEASFSCMLYVHNILYKTFDSIEDLEAFFQSRLVSKKMLGFVNNVKMEWDDFLAEETSQIEKDNYDAEAEEDRQEVSDEYFRDKI